VKMKGQRMLRYCETNIFCSAHEKLVFIYKLEPPLSTTDMSRGYVNCGPQIG
jgi:hypothetical protein